MGPAIVVAAYERPHSLRRILGSLAASRIPSGTTLIISIDRSFNAGDAVCAVAKDFPWHHGHKEVVVHPERLGLREHILRCGDYSLTYGAAIVLEDDLYVSPEFYLYTLAALAAYRDDPRIGGISLYNHRCNETARLAFRAMEDGSDCYFIQLASSWGQCWTREQWRLFRDWYGKHLEENLDTADLPCDVAEWPKTSWKKYFIKYLAGADRYFVFPRVSLTTNFADPGTHYKVPMAHLQVPLLMAPMRYRFTPLEASLAVYDSHCEILPGRLKQLAPALASCPFEVDLYGYKNKDRMKTPYVLTVRQTRSAVMRFGLAMKPHELNVMQGIAGSEISLARVEDRTAAFSVPRHERVGFYFDVPRNWNEMPEFEGTRAPAVYFLQK
jgi:hypothetical protein